MQVEKANAKTLYKLYCAKVKNPVDYKTFKSITDQFNKEISDKIILGYKFTPYSKVGVFRITLNFRKTNREKAEKYIDWGKSNKRKAEIIATGGTPYEEWWEKNGVRLEKKEEGAIKANNNGIKWLIFFNDRYFFRWSWWKDTHTKYTRHLTKYLFSATRKNKRSISTITEKVKSPEFVYVIHKKDKRKEHTC